MKFKKNIAFLFGILALITYFSIQNLPYKEIPVLKLNQEKSFSIYLLKEDLLVPMTCRMNVKNDEDWMQQYLDYVTGIKKLKNAKSFELPKLKLLKGTIKDETLTLQFNSTFFEIKEEQELLFLQSLIKMAHQMKGVKQLKILVNEQELNQMRYGTVIPKQIQTYQSINSFVNEDVLLHDSQSLIVYRLLKQEGKVYYVPLELRVSNQLSIKEKLQYIVSSSIYHKGLTSPFKQNDKIECSNEMINLQMKCMQEDETLKEQILNVIQLSLEANGISQVKIKIFDKGLDYTKPVINQAEY